MVPLRRPLDGGDETLAPLTITTLAARGVAQLDASLRGEVLDGGDEVEVLDLLHERDRVARHVAAEAAVAPGRLADVERTGLLGMEGAQPDPVLPRLA